MRAVTGHDLKLIAGPIELMKYHNTPPKLKVSKDMDMVMIMMMMMLIKMMMMMIMMM